MTLVQRYRQLYDYERDCNAKMLGMMESVPEHQRDDPRFSRALTLAGHLAACRENWLNRMQGRDDLQVAWWPEDTELDDLPARYAALEAQWQGYLAGLTDDDLDRDFEFAAGSTRYRWNVGGQIEQLVGHAHYHRGQVAQLVGALGGEQVDTDYLYWAIARDPSYGQISDS